MYLQKTSLSIIRFPHDNHIISMHFSCRNNRSPSINIICVKKLYPSILPSSKWEYVNMAQTSSLDWTTKAPKWRIANGWVCKHGRRRVYRSWLCHGWSIAPTNFDLIVDPSGVYDQAPPIVPLSDVEYHAQKFSHFVIYSPHIIMLTMLWSLRK
jgi:hypothetical protein